ncbi:MAG TPA: acyl-ACP--UDP-N-acetylglucosamine O-acyltransferase [Thiohalobacter sp.]|nr:acyl-ACP--UDP-N-acetylglucosamine O-acyltransferase [Thiohalobacter sp.]
MIHAQALVDPGATLAAGVGIGPFSVIGPDVSIEAGTVIGPHVVINGPTRIGRDNRIYQFASIGEAPQDKKYAGEPTELVIGDGNTIREGVTIHRGTVQDRARTLIGDDNWIMAYVHIAHDCDVGSHTILANNTALAGHVRVGDHAILGGFTLVHQFCAIGAHAFTAFGSVIGKDVPPFMMVSGHPARVHGLNSEGLKRRSFSADSLRALKQAYRTLYRSGLPLEQALVQLQTEQGGNAQVQALIAFLQQQTRGIVR